MMTLILLMGNDYYDDGDDGNDDDFKINILYHFRLVEEREPAPI